MVNLNPVKDNSLNNLNRKVGGGGGDLYILIPQQHMHAHNFINLFQVIIHFNTVEYRVQKAHTHTVTVDGTVDVAPINTSSPPYKSHKWQFYLTLPCPQSYNLGFFNQNCQKSPEKLKWWGRRKGKGERAG